MAQETRQELFARNGLQQFRERQIADIEQRAFSTMANHAKRNGTLGGPTVESELNEAFSMIQHFAERQVDKMKRMGIGDVEIRNAILGSIQSSTLNLPRSHQLAPMYSQLVETVNNNLDNYIYQKVDKQQFNHLKLA